MDEVTKAFEDLVQCDREIKNISRQISTELDLLSAARAKQAELLENLYRVDATLEKHVEKLENLRDQASLCSLRSVTDKLATGRTESKKPLPRASGAGADSTRVRTGSASSSSVQTDTTKAQSSKNDEFIDNCFQDKGSGAQRAEAEATSSQFVSLQELLDMLIENEATPRDILQILRGNNVTTLLVRSEELVIYFRQIISLLELSRSLCRYTEKKGALRLVHGEALHILDCERVTIFLVNHDRRTLSAAATDGANDGEIPEFEMPLDSGIAGYCATCNETVCVNNAYEDVRFNKTVDGQSGFRTRDVLCIPVRDHDRKVHAVLQAINKRSGKFSHADELIGIILASQVGIVLRNLDLYLQALDARARTDHILRACETVAAELEVRSLCRAVEQQTRSMLHADRSTFYMRERGTLIAYVRQGDTSMKLRIPFSQGIAGHVAATGKECNIEDVYLDARFNAEIDKRTGYRTRSVLCIPVPGSNGTVEGVIQAINKENGESSFSAQDVEMLRAFSFAVAVALENALLYDKTKQALEDAVQSKTRSLNLLNISKHLVHEFHINPKVLALAEEARTRCRGARCSVFHIDDATGTASTLVAEGAGRIELSKGVGIVGAVARTAQPIVENHPDQNAAFCKDVDEATGYRTTSIIAAPIKSFQGGVLGVIEVLNW